MYYRGEEEVATNLVSSKLLNIVWIEKKMKLQRRRGDVTQKAGMNHMFVASHRVTNSLSNHLTNMGQDRDLYTRIKGLENNMKLIMVAFNIIGVENTRTGT